MKTDRQPSEIYPFGILKAGDQLAISWNRGFFKSDSFDQIYILNDTGKLMQITENDSYSHFSPAWSPDGSKLCITESYSWAAWVYLADGDGTHLREITPDNGYMTALLWSPDSRYLLCVKPEAHDPASIVAPLRWLQYFLYDTENDHYRSINLSLEGATDYIWLQDENALLMAVQRRDETGQVILQKYHFDTEQITPLNIDYLQGISRIKFSPDSRHVVFTRPASRRDQRDTIYTARLDGSNLHHLTRLHRYNVDGELVWSPDGQKLAFTDIIPRKHKYALYVMDADGTNLKRLFTLNEGDDSGEVLPTMPVWSSDSQQLALPSTLEEGSAVFVMEADGANLRRITDIEGLIYDVVWKP